MALTMGTSVIAAIDRIRQNGRAFKPIEWLTRNRLRYTRAASVSGRFATPATVRSFATFALVVARGAHPDEGEWIDEWLESWARGGEVA